MEYETLTEYDATKFTMNDSDIVQLTYSRILSFTEEIVKCEQAMKSPLPEVSTYGKFDMRIEIGRSYYNKLTRKLKGEKRDRILEKYKKALDLATKFYQKRNSGRERNDKRFEEMRQKALKGRFNHWRQIYVNNILNQLSSFSIALVNAEIKFQRHEKSEEDTYEEIQRINEKLQALQIDDSAIYKTYERICKFSNTYAHKFKQPKDKKQVDATQNKDPIQTTFYDKGRDRLEESTELLKTMIDDADIMRKEKESQDGLFAEHTASMYNQMGEVGAYIENNSKIDDNKLEELVNGFYTTAESVDKENSANSQMNQYNSKISKCIQKIDTTTNNFLEKTAEFAHKEITNRVIQQTEIFKQVNILCKQYNFPSDCAELFYEYMDETKSLESYNISEVERITGIDLRNYPELATALSGYEKTDDYRRHQEVVKIKKLEPTKHPTDSNGDSSVSG